MSTHFARTALITFCSLCACHAGSEPNVSTSAAEVVPTSSAASRSAKRVSAPPTAPMASAQAMTAAPKTSQVAGVAAAGAAAAGATAGGSAVSPQRPAANGGAAGAASSAAGSGGSNGTTSSAAGSGSAGTPMLGMDCEVDPLANEAPFGSGFFQQFRGLMGCTAALDLARYRELLPEKFEMPADPQVCFYTLDFLISGVGPYHEAALLLPVEYAGAAGRYVLTMPLDSAAATSGGRAIGFPKYMSDVTLTQHGNDWSASVGNAMKDLEVEYTSECIAEDVFLWPDFINLTPIPAGETSSKAFLPPRDGRALMVPAQHLTEPKYYSLRGLVRLSIGDHLPWNGLIDETKPFTGYLTTFKGGIDLGNRPLD